MTRNELKIAAKNIELLRLKNLFITVPSAHYDLFATSKRSRCCSAAFRLCSAIFTTLLDREATRAQHQKVWSSREAPLCANDKRKWSMVPEIIGSKRCRSLIDMIMPPLVVN